MLLFARYQHLDLREMLYFYQRWTLQPRLSVQLHRKDGLRLQLHPTSLPQRNGFRYTCGPIGSLLRKSYHAESYVQRRTSFDLNKMNGTLVGNHLDNLVIYLLRLHVFEWSHTSPQIRAICNEDRRENDSLTIQRFMMTNQRRQGC